MDIEQGSSRDLATLIVPQAGQLVATGERFDPYRLLDPNGEVVQGAAVFFAELQAAGRSVATLRSYGMDLLRWFRFLWAVEVAWDEAWEDFGRARGRAGASEDEAQVARGRALHRLVERRIEP